MSLLPLINVFLLKKNHSFHKKNHKIMCVCMCIYIISYSRDAGSNPSRRTGYTWFRSLFVVFSCSWIHSNGTLQLEQSHQCCKERGYVMRDITLTCSKSSLAHFTYKHVTDCECKAEG